MKRWHCGLGLLLVAFAGCGGRQSDSPALSSQGGAPGGAGGESTVPAEAGAAMVAGGVAGCEPSQENLDETPRADQNAELLALAHSDGIVADQEVYERIAADVAKIRELEPLVADIDYRAESEPSTLLLKVSDDTFNRMEHGDYSAWDCLNSTYRVADIDYGWSSSGDHQYVILNFTGVYQLERLGASYAELPEVLGTEPSTLGGDGPTICLTASPTTWHYVFDQAGGDCPAGCTEHDFYHFTSQADGAVEALETWHHDYDVEAPSWVTEYASPEACR